MNVEDNNYFMASLIYREVSKDFTQLLMRFCWGYDSVVFEYRGGDSEFYEEAKIIISKRRMDNCRKYRHNDISKLVKFAKRELKRELKRNRKF